MLLRTGENPDSSLLSDIKGKSDAPSSGNQGRRRWRIVLYSHDTMGLGHKRRNLLIAQTLGSSTIDSDILMISGMRDASDVPTPDGVDCLTLPALQKREDGQYQSRRLGLELKEMIGLRSQLIRTAVKSFQPDVLIVDNVPRGAMRELDPTLDYVRSQPHIRCVLGLRDVLDTPDTVRRDWRRADSLAALRHYYDAIWIYGDPSLYDLRQEYDLPADIVAKMRPLGYLDQRPRLSYMRPNLRASLEALNLPQDNLVLCLVGGGQDGTALAQAFAQTTFPAGMTGVLVTGPFMPPAVQQTLFERASHNPQLRIVDYLEEPTLLLEQASRVVAMGGYNTTCEILSFQKPALLVPRITPRQEQWIRAERLQQMGLIDVLHPDHLSPTALTEWLHQPVAPNQVRPSVNLNGLDNLLVEMRHLLSAQPISTPRAS
ncbi:glycosyltransferase family protein [Nodosilinea sp. E11]|uniref:glycosyltransferase family protein n=1 Tax=Nodosilinea sp. E11 TaxID=3037479 RepID=UPI0029349D1E|nr:glycosyltransferase [Nodosilinea sp. E11]WOD37006.1 glycosyltransferase [Nodosilinea sp. E11]